MTLAGCGGGAQTSVTQLWKAPVPAAPIKTMLVFAAHLDEANRRALEDKCVAALAKHDVAAMPSYSLFPGEPPPRDVAKEIVKKAKFDAILVSTLRSVRERQTYIPGTTQGGFWYGYYGSGWGYWSPGYVMTDRIVDFDTTLWDARAEDQLVFALTTDTVNPSSRPEFVDSLTDTVVKALEKQRLIPPARD